MWSSPSVDGNFDPFMLTIMLCRKKYNPSINFCVEIYFPMVENGNCMWIKFLSYRHLPPNHQHHPTATKCMQAKTKLIKNCRCFAVWKQTVSNFVFKFRFRLSHPIWIGHRVYICIYGSAFGEGERLGEDLHTYKWTPYTQPIAHNHFHICNVEM